MILIVGAGWVALNWYANQSVLSTMEQDFTIEKGDSLSRIANRLETLGVLEYPEAFSIIGQLSGMAGGLHAGDYQIVPGMSRRQLLVMFTQGRVRYYDVTLVEGHTLSEVVEQLNAHPKLAKPLTQEDARPFFESLGIDGSPEGLFYPDTYFFEAGTPVKAILARAHKKLNVVLEKEWAGRAKGLPLENSYEALILASVIEKETGASFERPDISGVFIRRLQKGMRLQSDPTVIYGMGERYQGQLNRRMLREKTLYNTYVIKGLPPTPIALVGREAIRAALHPADGKMLYFVAKGDGTHYFSESLAEHNKAVRKYQITERRSDYRSTVETN